MGFGFNTFAVVVDITGVALIHVPVVVEIGQFFQVGVQLRVAADDARSVLDGGQAHIRAEAGGDLFGGQGHALEADHHVAQFRFDDVGRLALGFSKNSDHGNPPVHSCFGCRLGSATYPGGLG